MKRYFNRIGSGLLMVVCCMAMFSRCSSSDDNPRGSVEVTLRHERVGANDTEQFINVRARGSWTMSVEHAFGADDNPEPWCFLDEADQSGTGNKRNIILRYYRNTSPSERTAYIVITSGNEEYRVALVQEGDADASTLGLALSQNEVAGNDPFQRIAVTATGLWNITFEYPAGSPTGWATASPSQGTGNRSDVLLSYTVNDTGAPRSVDVVLTAGDQSQSVRATLTQRADTGTELVQLELESENIAYTQTPQNVSVKCVGAWTLELEYISGGNGWSSLSSYSGTGPNPSITLITQANMTQSDRQVAIVLTAVATGTMHRVTLTQSGMTDAPTYPQWMELPDMSSISPTTLFVYHNTNIDGREMRNFSLLYDTEHKLAYWVAYPMHSMYIGSTDRTNAWDFDPKILPRSLQGNVGQGDLGWYHSDLSGDDRGHQIPSADRTANRLTNEQTFFYSNITPQASLLNQRMWSNLEGQVRGWRNTADTLYVVTGAILQTVGGNERITYLNDLDGQPVARPNYYYKVLLHMRGSTYNAIGYWFENRGYGNGNPGRDRTLTVRRIEELTGFNFFANLPQATQDRVENAIDYNFWGVN